MVKSDKPVPASWVNARKECSLQNVFKVLGDGCKADVRDALQALIPAHSHRTYAYDLHSNGKFSVTRCEDAMLSGPCDSVDFEIVGHEIVVTHMFATAGKNELLRASLTLNNDGECKMLVDGQELEQWQVRRMALEKLFFKP